MSKKILVVDDDKNIIQLQKVLFTKHGFDVVTASNGVEAIEIAVREIPDIVVLDIDMPGKDGYATLLEMRSYKELRDIPVIILSALSDDIYHNISSSLGTVYHLDKPFSPDELLMKVKEIISSKGG